VKNKRWQTGANLAVCAVVSAALFAGCSTGGTAPSKAKPAAAAKAEAKKPSPPAKPKLAMPQIEKTAVPPPAIAPFDWRSDKVAAVKRADVLADIEKKERRDEFDAMIQATEMDGKQLAGFLAATQDRLARLAAWEGSEKGKRRVELRTRLVPEAQEGTDDAKLKKLAIELNQLDAEYGALRVAVRGMVMGVMTLEQQRAWAASALLGVASRSLRGTQLDADQRKRALAICAGAVKDVIKEDTVASDPYLNCIARNQGDLVTKTVQRIKSEVLTKEQQAALAPAAK
jgi:PBP1b-binding outer membrane lipoprotein LpoB